MYHMVKNSIRSYKNKGERSVQYVNKTQIIDTPKIVNMNFILYVRFDY
jgi:hypothetical protein